MTENNRIEYKQELTDDLEKEIMRVYKDLDMVEQLGSGVPRILHSYSKDCFKFSDNYLRMTFPKSVHDKGMDDYDNDKKQVSIEGGQIGGQIDDLTDRQLKVLKLIVNDNRTTRKKLADELSINQSAVQGHIDALKSKGVIERIGGTRGYWKINKQIITNK